MIDTFPVIRPINAPAFIAAQFIGGAALAALALASLLAEGRRAPAT